MDRSWAVNSSPLIVLGKIGLLSILPRLSSTLIIPSQVAAEGNSFVTEFPIESRVLAWNLGAGESALLSWCIRHREYEALIDDRAARNCADTFGVGVRGTLSILVVAKSEGLIPSVKPLIDEMRSQGFRLSDEAIDAVLLLAGE